MSIRVRTYCTSLLFAAVASFGFGPGAIAQDASWHVSKASGEVAVTHAGVQQASVTDETILQPGDNIRTGQTGRVLLVRGNESMLISPNSIIGIPTTNSDGMSTTIIQRAGSILLDVEKRNVKHFEVETPYLAAVVKGTQFRVTVDKGDAHVDVLRGQVEVSDLKSGQFALIAAGQTAKVAARGSTGLSLNGSGTLSPIQQGAPRSSSLTPLPASDEDLSAPVTMPKPQQFHDALMRANGDSVVASSERTTGWAPSAAEVGEDNGDVQPPRKNEIISALSVPFGVGLLVAVTVTTYRQRQKKKDDRQADR
jgi:hypothetical protein